MLVQIHHQLGGKINQHEMVAQSNINNQKELQSFADDVKKTHPLPSDKYQWLVCNEKSEHFTWAVERKNDV